MVESGVRLGGKGCRLLNVEAEGFAMMTVWFRCSKRTVYFENSFNKSEVPFHR